MTSHHLTIAKATFAASLLRPDVTKISRDELPHFQHLLESAMQKCTPSNIQCCKQWLLNHIIPSNQRTASFGKYLSTLSKYISDSERAGDGTSVSRQRLHLIYLLNDILHHTKHHDASAASTSNVSAPLDAFLPDLFRYAASEQKHSVCKRLDVVVDIWQQEAYIPGELLAQLRASVSEPMATTVVPGGGDNKKSTASKDLPFVMPSTHGDLSLPFYELPAGNFMPHIVPNRSTSMRPESIRPLQFVGGAADEGLVNAVKDFLKDVARIDDAYAMEDESVFADIDELGQPSYRDETGEVIGDTYYGWSRAFCDKMKARRNPQSNGSRSKSRSQSYSSSRSPGPRRKRRLRGSSGDRSRSRSRYRSRRSSGERSRSPVSMQPVDTKAPTPSSRFAPPPLLLGNMPVPPPRPPNWPAGSPWPPPPPPPSMGRGGFPPPPFPPPPDFPGYPAGASYSPSNGLPRYRAR